MASNNIKGISDKGTRKKWGDPVVTVNEDPPTGLQNNTNNRNTSKGNTKPVGPSKPIDGGREYKNNSVDQLVNRRQPKVKQNYSRPPEKSVVGSTAQSDFRGEITAKRKSFKPDNQPYSSGAAFEGSGTSANDYKEYPIQRHVIKKPTSAKVLKGEGRVEGVTNYAKDYPGWEAHRPVKSTKPRYVQPEGDFENNTSNKLDYPVHSSQKRTKFQPKDSTIKSTDPLDTYTGYKDTYVEHPLQPKEAKARDTYQPPEETMETNTSNKQDYPAFEVQKRKSYKPPNDSDGPYAKGGEQTDGVTNYAKDYPEFETHRPVKSNRPEYVKPEGDFENNTSNKLDYPAHNSQKRTKFQPKDSALKSTDPLDTYTGYKDTYVEHPLQPKQAKTRDKYHAPEQSMETHTSNKQDYPAFEVQKRKSYKPTGDSDGPYAKDGNQTEGLTNYAKDYPEFETHRPVKSNRPEYVKPEGDFENNTSNKLDYPAHASQKRTKFQLKDSALKSTDPLDTYTGYNDTYVEHPLQSKQAKARDKYQPPEQSMETHTSNKQDYPAFEVQKRKSYKPTGDSDGPYAKDGNQTEGLTNYAKDYPEFETHRPVKSNRPEYVKPEGDFENNTSNKLDYPAHASQKRTKFQPKDSALKSTDPLDTYTGYKGTYVEHPLQPKQAKARDKYQPPEQSMETHTSNQKDYPAFEVQKRKSYKPTGDSDGPYAKDGNQTEGLTNYAKDYPEFEAHRPVKSNRPEYVKPEGEFENNTSSKLDYPVHTSQKRIKFQPKDSALKSTDPLDTYTGYKDTYVEHPLQPKQAKARDKYQPPEQSMETHTSNKQDYPAFEVQKRKSYKPTGDLDGPYAKDGNQTEGLTNYAKDYPEFETHRPVKSNRPEYVKPEGDFENNTSNKLDYPAHASQKRTKFQPKDSALKSTDPLDTYTGYKGTYVEHPLQPKQEKARDKYQPPEQSMETHTSNQKDYPAFEVQKRKSYKPTGDSDGPYAKDGNQTEGLTNYAKDYPEFETHRPVKSNRPEYVKPEGDFENNTSNKLDYPAHASQKRTKFQPKDSALKSTDPLDTYTGYKDTYVEHPIQAKQAKARDKYQPPEQSMETHTSNKQDYPAFEVQKRKSYKPTGDSDGPYAKDGNQTEGLTNYAKDYPEFETHRPVKSNRPEYVKPEGDFENNTSNKLDYPAHASQKRTKFQPKDSALKSTDPLDTYTGYKGTYVEHPLQPKQAKARDKYQPPEQSMETHTSNQKDYPAFEVQKRKSYKPTGDSDGPYAKDGNQTEGLTNYAKDYPEFEAHRPVKSNRLEYVKPEGEFENNTSNKLDYPVHTLQKRTKFQPKDSALKSTDPLDTYTGYKDTYVEHPIQAKEAKIRNTYHPPEQSMETHTSNKQDYPAFDIQKRKSYKPTGDSDGPYAKDGNQTEGLTNYAKDYPEFEAHRPVKSNRPEYVKPEGDFENNTSNKLDYPAHNSQKRTKFQPKDSALKSTDPLDTYTGYKDTYVEHPLQAKEAKIRNKYQPPEQSMETHTSNKQDYLAFEVQKRRSYKPTEDSLKPEGPFYGNTGYNDIYKEHPVQTKQKREVYHQDLKSEGEMFTETVNQQTYTVFSPQKRTSKRPTSSDLLKASGKFESGTGYSDVYKEHTFTKDSKMNRKQEKYYPPTVPLETRTTNHEDFTTKPASKRSGYGPAKDPVVYNQPFEASSTNKDDYQQRDFVKVPTLKRQSTYVKSSEPMDFQTTNTLTFRGETAPKRTKTRPTSSNTLKYDGNFYGETNYRGSYTERGTTLRHNQLPALKGISKQNNEFDWLRSSAPVIMGSSYKDSFTAAAGASTQRTRRVPEPRASPLAPFEGMSIFKSDFKGESGSKRTMYRPPQIADLQSSNAPFDGTTTNSSDFRGTWDSKRPQRIRPSNESFMQTAVRHDTEAWSGPQSILSMA